MISADDVLVSTVRPNLNAVAIVPSELDGQIASRGFCVLRPNPSVVNARFLFYRALTRDFVGYLIARMRGANYPAVTDEVVRKATIPLPLLSEQRRIVEILDQADTLRNKRAEADAKAERILHTVFVNMFGDPVRNPKGWGVEPLGNLVDSIAYGLAERLSLVDTAETGVPIVRISNIMLNGDLDLSDMRYWPAGEALVEKLRLLPGDLLFNWRNGSPEHIGKTALWDTENTHIFVSFLLRIRCGGNGLNPFYLWMLLNILRSSGFFVRTSRMQINRKFNGTELSRLPIIKPPNDLQKRFEKRSIEFLSVQKSRKNCVRKFETLFETLLHRAFSGDLTAKWREGHMKELLAEMEEQAKYLGALGPQGQRENAARQESLF